MKLVWYPHTLGQAVEQNVEVPWTRIEKLTAVAVVIGVVSTIWSIYTYGSRK